MADSVISCDPGNGGTNAVGGLRPALNRVRQGKPS